MNINGREVDLVSLCRAINATEHKVGEVEVSLAEEAAEVLRRAKEQWPEDTAPPSEVARDLSHVGWLVYVTSWEILQAVETNWSGLRGERLAKAQRGMALLRRLDDAARLLPWPEYAPRALGAYRTHALGLSKEDTADSYRDAWSLHRQADGMYTKFRLKVQKDAKLTRALDEVQVQLRLAETGTSCREPEQIVTMWHTSDDVTGGLEVREEEAFVRMLQGLERGTAHGNEAIGLLQRLDAEDPFGTEVDEFRLLTRSNYRNPGIMTARAHLIMLPMTTLMEAWELPATHGHNSWDDARKHLLDSAIVAYAVTEQELAEKFRDDHLRQMVQLRLMLAIVAPGIELTSALEEFSQLPAMLDADAVTALSDWLRAGDHDANIIGSAMMPAYLAGLHLLIGPQRWSSYVDWRIEHIRLDKQVRNQADPAGRLAEFRRAAARAETIAHLTKAASEAHNRTSAPAAMS